MNRKSQRVWVVIGDGVHAQVYVVKTMRPVRVEALSTGHFRGRKQATPYTDHIVPAASFTDDGGARHPVSRHPDHHRLDKEIFVEHLSDFINNAGRNRDFDSLVLVAPNKALGDLRQGLDKEVQEKIKIEVDGEWTKLSQLDLERHLAAHVAEATEP
jgi:protein required for attachment to host cells